MITLKEKLTLAGIAMILALGAVSARAEPMHKEHKVVEKKVVTTVKTDAPKTEYVTHTKRTQTEDGKVTTTSEVYVIEDTDRDVIRKYYADNKQAWCPPGLAKKDPSCIPPGLTKVHYTTGTILPETVVYYPLPETLSTKLRPLPEGYKYVQVDGEVLVISEATKKVMDAMVLLSGI